MSQIERWRCVEVGPHRSRMAILGANNDHVWGYVTIESPDISFYEVGTEYVVSTRPVVVGQLSVQK